MRALISHIKSWFRSLVTLHGTSTRKAWILQALFGFILAATVFLLTAETSLPVYNYHLAWAAWGIMITAITWRRLSVQNVSPVMRWFLTALTVLSPLLAFYLTEAYITYAFDEMPLTSAVIEIMIGEADALTRIILLIMMAPFLLITLFLDMLFIAIRLTLLWMGVSALLMAPSLYALLRSSPFGQAHTARTPN